MDDLSSEERRSVVEESSALFLSQLMPENGNGQSVSEEYVDCQSVLSKKILNVGDKRYTKG